MFHSSKNKNDSGDVKELAELQSKVEKVLLQEKQGERGVRFDTKVFFRNKHENS